MTRKINETGLEHLKRWEGLRLQAYPDVKGVWTIGYGHTSAAGTPYVQKGLKITAEQAETIFARDLGQYEPGCKRRLKCRSMITNSPPLSPFVIMLAQAHSNAQRCSRN